MGRPKGSKNKPKFNQVVEENVQEIPVVVSSGSKVYSHSAQEIMKLEQSTGLEFSGYVQDDSGVLIPVLMKSGKTREEKSKKVLEMHHG